MNERIKELAYEAEDYADGIVDQGGEFHEAYTQKFAELIVRECYEECKGQMLPWEMAESEGYTYNDGVMDCAIGLLQHFGVEE